MARSWTAGRSPSTSLARARSVRAEAEAVVASSAADVAVAVAVAVIATKSSSVAIWRGSGKPGLAFFISRLRHGVVSSGWPHKFGTIRRNWEPGDPETRSLARANEIGRAH